MTLCAVGAVSAGWLDRHSDTSVYVRPASSFHALCRTLVTHPLGRRSPTRRRVSVSMNFGPSSRPLNRSSIALDAIALIVSDDGSEGKTCCWASVQE